VGDGRAVEEERLNMERRIGASRRVLEEEMIVGIIVDVNNGKWKTKGDGHSGTFSGRGAWITLTESSEGLKRGLPAGSLKKL
ncbi:MAG TPA: hypothetical protein VHI52_22060, partial [Verrucomicrobiae bacterium]|nr:hypothetical protein [Verrucomicrobiae bacterium]